MSEKAMDVRKEIEKLEKHLFELMDKLNKVKSAPKLDEAAFHRYKRMIRQTEDDLFKLKQKKK